MRREVAPGSAGRASLSEVVRPRSLQRAGGYVVPTQGTIRMRAGGSAGEGPQSRPFDVGDVLSLSVLVNETSHHATARTLCALLVGCPHGECDGSGHASLSVTLSRNSTKMDPPERMSSSATSTPSKSPFVSTAMRPQNWPSRRRTSATDRTSSMSTSVIRVHHVGHQLVRHRVSVVLQRL